MESNKRIIALFERANFKWLKSAMSLKLVILVTASLLFNSCLISYKFNGASIDYSKIKSISISDFPNNAQTVYAPLSQLFSDKLRDVYARNTRLEILRRNGDLQLQGAIVGYQLTPMAISENTYASQTKLTVTINVSFTDTKNPNDSFTDKKYVAYRTFDSSKMLTDVQDELLGEITDEITDEIYNDTVARW